ncbi:hypothetical protein B0H66DRAFT_515109 [Apodospora peruviana]|uniref:Septin-type G domain-containing protein n=1 Tax=Apodospora peruviana TaxID=516989 RepID=A0AAE0M8K8_9PEZI|nr:hypothetical protein B0H66DRAFT_515109 [Apodospora peruviana]
MRPFPGDDALGRPRAPDGDSPSNFTLPPGPQMTYMFADEASIGSSAPPHQQQPPISPLGMYRPKQQEIRKVSGGTESSEGKLRGGGGPSHHRFDKDTGSRPSSSSRVHADMVSPRQSEQHQQDALPMTPPFRPVSNPSGPVTPIILGGTSGPASALSSVSSRRNSLCGSLSEDLNLGGSQPSASVDGEATYRDQMPASMMYSGSAPQLIMPSIKMPSRRPFTEEGKAMGRLKVMIAGGSGLGKTSLIKAIVQSCEHIVHVDPIAPSPLGGSSFLSRPGTRHRNSPSSRGRQQTSRGGSDAGTTQITEIYASTKPYPEWWSEIDDFRVLRRRKSLGDTVLDRNICFVDTPGYSSLSSTMDTITPVARYVETHLQRMRTNALADGDVLNLLGGEGGVQVDVVFYLVSDKLQPVDTVYLRQLAPLTNIIILLAQTDLSTPEHVAASKEQILGQLKEADIRLFSFAMPSSAPSSLSSTPDSSSAKTGLYAISSAAGCDHEIMDASLLMSPDYVQPLISTELESLVEQVFSQNGAAWLRHSAARKYVQWRKTAAAAETTNHLLNPIPRSPTMPASTPATPRSSLGAGVVDTFSNGLFPSAFSSSSTPQNGGGGSGHLSQVLTPPIGATSSYALARITDHTQREERLAQVRLANWAADLQKSLANERAQYEAVARGDRAIWLTEKLNECVQDGTLVAVRGSCSPSRREDASNRLRYRAATQAQARDGVGALTRGWSGGSERRQASLVATTTTEQHQDPLGLLQVAADLRYKGILALEVLGSLGVLGGLALWMTRLQPYDWIVGEWDRIWGAR